MPNSNSHGWLRATSLALLVPLLLSLPSCMTGLLWCASDKNSHRAGIDTLATTSTLADGGVQSIGVQFAEDLPATVATSLDRAAIGRWFEVRLREPSPALAEIVRLRDAGAASNASFVVWLYHDDDARIEATASVGDAHLADVRVTKGLRIDRDSDQPTQLHAYASGKLLPAADAPEGSQPLAGASLSWWQSRSEPHPLWAKVVLTPVTAAMDVTLMPVLLLAGGYMWVYTELGGRG
jgi:hypothetical protein